MSKVQELQHVSLATTYEVDNTFDSDKFIKMRLRVCHDGVNPNSSNFEVADMEKAQDTIKNIPILANVIFDDENQPQFGGHDMAIEEDKCNEGEYRLVYKETPIGIVPESCNHTIEMFNDKNYVFVDAYIWKGYSNYAQDIIERDNDIKLSMEIKVDEYSYNAKKKCYNITDYRYTGITFLNKDFGTGMKDALATTGTFEENSKEKFIMMMEELKDTLSTYNINKNNKEGGVCLEEKIAILEKYNLTVESIDFSIEDISLEEIEEKAKALFEANKAEKVDESETNKDKETFEEKKEENIAEEKFVKSFELSHSDIRYALYNLLSPVENEDNEWYFIDQVYDTRFEYMNWEGTKIYRQGYVKDGDNVSFEGDRVELFQEKLTKEEKDALDKMRGDFAQLECNYNKLKEENDSLKEFKLAKENADKEEVFAKFEGLTEEDIAEIKEKISEYTLETLEEKLFALWGKKKMELEKGKNFSKKEKQDKKDKLVFSIVDGVGNTDKNQPIYADIINKHKK